ncbi:hypothetical protein SNE35_14595 [Paucibacter sp. R3-3]|uniref:Histidine kinase n=1 Tax=Roseateles agri TaxID=3098619 RepID=A0ABU5DHI4_9BURK|nr:hypothetical protein [Paucibacter sp. R3-3]MDY0745746.1 hypothetical protein [Paucibacter sp. R3-3]
MQLETYWAWCGLEGVPADLAEAVRGYRKEMELRLQPEALERVEVQWAYRVPELGEGGSCSLFGQLAERPYDLAGTLGGRTDANRRLLGIAATAVQYYRERSRSQWFGVYQSRGHAAGNPVLVKLAYFGAESRAEFPLTPEFAAGSNNSAVGLSGTGRLINDVASYVAEGGGYYTCDPKVKSEACLPLFNERREVIGIVDAEAFEAHVFEGEELALLLAVTSVLSGGLIAA